MWLRKKCVVFRSCYLTLEEISRIQGSTESGGRLAIKRTYSGRLWLVAYFQFSSTSKLPLFFSVSAELHNWLRYVLQPGDATALFGNRHGAAMLVDP